MATGSRRQQWTILGGLCRLGPGFLFQGLWAFLRGGRRSLAEDARRVVALMEPPPRIDGLDRVPRSEPFVLVANHFQTPDLWIGWVAAAIAHAVALARDPDRWELHWLAISEWRWFEVAGHWIPNPITSVLFPRAAAVWGLVSLPARPSDVAGRARALRRVLAYLRRPTRHGNPNPEPVGIFPEGRATYALEEALPGSGAFLHRISSLGVPLLPLGAFLEGDVLTLRFGEPFQLEGGPAGGETLDDWARRRVMVAIGRLLPERLWGIYREDILRR